MLFAPEKRWLLLPYPPVGELLFEPYPPTAAALELMALGPPQANPGFVDTLGAEPNAMAVPMLPAPCTAACC